MKGNEIQEIVDLNLGMQCEHITEHGIFLFGKALSVYDSKECVKSDRMLQNIEQNSTCMPRGPRKLDIGHDILENDTDATHNHYYRVLLRHLIT